VRIIGASQTMSTFFYLKRKQACKVLTGFQSHLRHTDAAQQRDFFGNVLHISRLIEFTAKRHRRKIRRICFNQHPV